MIQIQNVSKSYARRTVLDTVNLHLVEGKTHIFLGSSGSGKSTLMKLIMGLISPNQGSITFNDSVLSAMTDNVRARHIGYVLQEGGLFPHMTMRENITLQARLGSWSIDKMNARMNELTELVGFEESWLERFPRQLSGGQRQRGAVMRALFLDPQILLLDEPLGALDPLIRSKLQEDLRAIFKRLKKLVILVTHDLGEAAFFGDTITLFHEGRIVQHGTLDHMIHHPNEPFVTEFIQAQRTLHIPGVSL
jgi:osmoprotectant transport system ATP-binding protein